MRRDFLEEAQRWLDQSKFDLRAARYNTEGNNYYLACFLAQQVGEKAMKAYFYAKGEEFVFGHSVMELCKRASIEEPDFKDIVPAGRKLDRYYIPTRYPNGLPGGIPAESFDENDATEAIRLAEQIFNRAEEIIIALGSKE